MYLALQSEVQSAVREFCRTQFNLEVNPVVNIPPRPEMGDMALPLALELARKLKRAPRQIAEEIAAQVEKLEIIDRVEIAGAGFINLFLKRSDYALEMNNLQENIAASGEKIIVEHTNINPNKAAHIGHLRNAALGDTFIRLLRARGQNVEVQNYIDNTGVQVADVVVGFLYLEENKVDDIAKLIEDPEVRFDFYCWDLYARVSRHFDEKKDQLELRQKTLHAIEHDEGESAQIAAMVSNAIVNRHLKTMLRLGVEYDVLPRESEILHLKFWDQAFRLLKEKGAIELETEGKNQGCWVMRPEETSAEKSESSKPPDLSNDAEGGENQEIDETKVIVRSNGTVTYVGKDIAYQLWKFGLLGRDFHYHRFHTYPDGHVVWVSTAEENSESAKAPAFGKGAKVYNVIDVRQSYLQNIVVAGLRALGYTEEAERSVHFSYEMVAMSPRTCEQMGVELSPEDKRRPYVEVSGRKGLGIKADDLIDRLIDEAQHEVDARHPEDASEVRREIAEKIAIGALRYFLLKYTCTSVIAFDFQEALRFEGETGPYVQYAVVRARNIFRKLEAEGGSYDAATVTPEVLARFLAPPDGDTIWQMLYLASQWEAFAEQAIVTTEPATVAKYTFQLAQAFNDFYHKYRILTEQDTERKVFLLWVVATIDRQLSRTLDLLGIEIPHLM